MSCGCPRATSSATRSSAGAAAATAAGPASSYQSADPSRQRQPCNRPWHTTGSRDSCGGRGADRSGRVGGAEGLHTTRARPVA